MGTAVDGPARSKADTLRLSFHCAVCGYGAVRSTPPERCPMCQGEVTWLRSPRRPIRLAASHR